MVHASMYDAINGIDGNYHPYRVTSVAPAGASGRGSGSCCCPQGPHFPVPYTDLSSLNTLYDTQLQGSRTDRRKVME